MIDYKPIADAMRHCKYKTTKAECKACAIHRICKNYKGFIEDYAADVIEHLQKERDAAVADLKEVKSCETCKHMTEMDDDLCIKCARSFGLKYEWRGLSLAEKTSDKEEKE